MMNAMMDYIEEELLDDDDFSKLVLENLIDSGVVSGKDCCMVLFDQGVLDSSKDSEYEALVNGSLSAYSFMYKKIQKLEIKPSQLALDPCAGSIVVTDTNTGKVKALVSYPSYDNNKLANNLDDDYYSSLLEDKTSPFLNRAMQSSTAPGSTFKMVSASAALTEGIVSTSEKINCTGIYDKIALSPKCSVYPSSHGKIDISKAIEVSCNIFFFEVGYRLSTKSDGTYDEDYGLKRLQSYAALFGLDQNSGIELDENAPQISTQDTVRSAIGQGNNSFTPSQLSRYVTTIANNGTCFNLSILDKQTDSEGTTVKEYEPSVLNEVDLSDTVWKAIHKGMYNVVHGTQHGDVFKGMKTEVAGKTGTAEEDSTRPAHALFVSYAPYDKSEISVTVVVPYGYSSSNAMEIAKDVYSYYFNEGNDSEDNDNAEKDAEDTEEQAGDDDTEESAEQD
jgi:penicillin-binding protein 2